MFRTLEIYNLKRIGKAILYTAITKKKKAGSSILMSVFPTVSIKNIKELMQEVDEIQWLSEMKCACTIVAHLNEAHNE